MAMKCPHFIRSVLVPSAECRASPMPAMPAITSTSRPPPPRHPPALLPRLLPLPCPHAPCGGVEPEHQPEGDPSGARWRAGPGRYSLCFPAAKASFAPKRGRFRPAAACCLPEARRPIPRYAKVVERGRAARARATQGDVPEVSSAACRVRETGRLPAGGPRVVSERDSDGALRLYSSLGATSNLSLSL